VSRNGGPDNSGNLVGDLDGSLIRNMLAGAEGTGNHNSSASRLSANVAFWHKD
jgi:hypothetical protein